jgi:hypothetical protein
VEESGSSVFYPDVDAGTFSIKAEPYSDVSWSLSVEALK